jgi:hypothetical protein
MGPSNCFPATISTAVFEASMTAAFVIGPIGAIIGLVTGTILSKRKPLAVDVPKQRD